MATFIFDQPFHQLPFLYCLIIVLCLYSTLALTQTGSHSISLIGTCTSPSQQLPTPHTCSYKTSASVADMAGHWEDRRGFSLQKHENLKVEYQVSMVWKVIGPLCILHNYHPTHLSSPTLFLACSSRKAK